MAAGIDADWNKIGISVGVNYRSVLASLRLTSNVSSQLCDMEYRLKAPDGTPTDRATAKLVAEGKRELAR